MQNIKLRPYQEKYLTEVRESSERKIAIKSPTGSGKTEMIKVLINEARKKNQKVLLVAYGILVVNNLHKRIGHPSGIIMQGTPMNENLPIQIMSISTYIPRKKTGKLKFLKDFDLVIIDEAHNCVQNSYLNLFEYLGDKLYIGFSATFFKIGNKFHTFWDKCINNVCTRDLIKLNFLNEYQLFIPEGIKTEQVKLTAGDFNLYDLERVSNTNVIVGSIVKHYQDLAQNRVALVFCVSVLHSQNIRDEFLSAGIKAVHVDANTPLKIRNQYIKELREHSILKKPYIITNILTMAIAVDIPELEVLIHARPTMSETLYVQSIGRVMRVTPGHNRKVIIIDMTRNVYYHGLPCIKRFAELIQPKKKMAKKKERILPMVICNKCFAFNPKHSKTCTHCGALLPEPKGIIPESEEGKLIEYQTKEDLKKEILNFCKEKKVKLQNARKALQRKIREVGDYNINKLNEKVLDKAFEQYKTDMYFVASKNWLKKHKENSLIKSLKGFT